MSCPVCVESYSKERRKVISCEFCDYLACSQCVKQYVLSTPDTPHCMNCRKGWGRLSLAKKFTKSFMNNEYKKARENILFNLERSMFPETQPYVENALQILKNNARITELTKDVFTMRHRRALWTVVDIDTKVIELDMRKAIIFAEHELELLEFTNQTLSRGVNEDRIKESKTFVKACPRENCKGFLSSRWKCGICEHYTCRDCHEPIDEHHTCDANTVETIKHLKTSEYKPCPSCGVIISKINGCSQMFCTNPSCRTAFDWVTLRIVTGKIHNPHYYEYIRTRGHTDREIGDIQCDALPDYIGFYHAIRTKQCFTARQITMFSEFHRLVLDMRDHIQNPEMDVFQLNLSERISYMMGRTTEVYFKSFIQQRDKCIHKQKELSMVKTTFVQIVTDILMRLMVETSKSMVQEIEQEIKTACEYVNGLFKDVAKAYNCVVPQASLNPPEIKNHKLY